MKRLLLCLILWLPFSASAYEPACVPDRYGTAVPSDGLMLKYGRTADGWWAYWFCKRPDGSVKPEGFWCVHGECLSPGTVANAWRETAPGVAADPAAAAKSYIAANVTLDPVCENHPDGAKRRICLHRRALVRADLEKLLPPEGGPVWVVKKNGTAVDRPAYPWGATRGTTSNGRAVVGSACNPAVGRLETGGAYFGVNGRSDQVAICEQAP
jgi:hypothetical protein